MMKRAALAAALSLSLGIGGNAFAQSKATQPTVLPVVNSSNGKVEAFLQLDPVAAQSGAKWRFGTGSLENAFGLGSGESLALVCTPRADLSRNMRGLTDDCLLGSLGNGTQKRNIAAILGKSGTRLGGAVGKTESGLPSWLAPTANGRMQSTNIALYAEQAVGRNGVVSIAGTTANARLVPAADMPMLADRWNTKSLSVGGGVGIFRANVIGRVVTVPGRPNWEALGLGVSWRTPWSGQLSVGAENIVTKGNNPFAPKKAANDDATVPYVRYEQDL